jgi:hypothetical protein
LPEINDAGDWVWHLVLPPTEHLLRASDQLTAANSWSWSGRFFSRHPTLSQASLEEWTGASQQPSPEGAHEYFFSSFSALERTEFLTITRRSMVACGSGSALLVGLLLIYVPKLRHPVALLVSAVALATVAFVLPDPAVLVGQASVFGIVLAVMGQFISLVLRRLNVDRPFVQLPVRRGGEFAGAASPAVREHVSSAVTTVPFPVPPVSLLPKSDSKA